MLAGPEDVERKAGKLNIIFLGRKVR